MVHCHLFPSYQVGTQRVKRFAPGHTAVRNGTTAGTQLLQVCSCPLSSARPLLATQTWPFSQEQWPHHTGVGSHRVADHTQAAGAAAWSPPLSRGHSVQAPEFHAASHLVSPLPDKLVMWVLSSCPLLAHFAPQMQMSSMSVFQLQSA